MQPILPPPIPVATLSPLRTRTIERDALYAVAFELREIRSVSAGSTDGVRRLVS